MKLPSIFSILIQFSVFGQLLCAVVNRNETHSGRLNVDQALLVDIQARSFPPTCNRIIDMYDGDSYEFQSLNYPNVYPHFSLCTWIFQSTDLNTEWSITCPAFSLPDLSAFTASALCLRVRSDNEAHQYCGNQGPNNAKFVGSFLEVNFISLVNFQFTGFSCKVTANSDVTPPEPEEPVNDECGYSDVLTTTKIVGGQEAKEHSYPWQAALLMQRFGSFNYNYRCGGSLIHKRWILTAAHCFDSSDLSIIVHLGAHDKSIDEDGSIKITVYSLPQNVIVHEDYDPQTQENDIALIKLPYDVVYSKTIRRVCLGRDADITEAGKATYTGWGTKAYESTVVVNKLNEVTVDMITIAQCKEKNAMSSFVTDERNVCTLTAGKDACQGDSGGPLVIQKEDKRFTQVGIVSWGIECANIDHPGVNTKVAHFLPWITQKTNNEVSK